MRLGFMVSELGDSQLGYQLTHNINEHTKHHQHDDIIVFYNNITKPPTTPLFAMMGLVEAFDYTGATIATSLDTAQRLLRAPGPIKKFLYLWDLEWTRYTNYDHHKVCDLYTDKRLGILARCDDHAKIFGQVWGRQPDYIVGNCNIREMIRATQCA